jgi:HEAT repeat protein
MRTKLALGIVLLLIAETSGAARQGEEAAVRYDVHARLQDFPQATAKQTLASVLEALDQKRINYVLAQLTDPDFVDRRVKNVYGGNFEELVKETSTKLADNPATFKELRRFLTEGEWQGSDSAASVKLKDVNDRQVFFRKIGTRWYMENRQKAEAGRNEAKP